MVHATELFRAGSLEDILNTTPNRFDLTGIGLENYIDDMKEYLAKSKDGKNEADELYGLVAVDEKLYGIIQAFADKELEGSLNGWLLMCYYYDFA